MQSEFIGPSWFVYMPAYMNAGAAPGHFHRRGKITHGLGEPTKQGTLFKGGSICIKGEN